MKARARPLSRAGRWARRLAAFVLVLMLVAGVAHRTGWLDTIAFLWTFGLALVLTLAAAGMGVLAFVHFWRRGDRALADIGWALAFVLIALTPFAFAAYGAVTYPELSDISTDTANPPGLRTAERERTPAMNAVAPISPEAARLQAEKYPLVAGRRYSVPLERVEEVVGAMIEARGWPVLGVRERVGARTDVTIEAAAQTLVLGFWADVAVRLTDEEGITFVDMRSASRYGRHDLGDNAARITDFLSELDFQVVTRTPAAPAT